MVQLTQNDAIDVNVSRGGLDIAHEYIQKCSFALSITKVSPELDLDIHFPAPEAPSTPHMDPLSIWPVMPFRISRRLSVSLSPRSVNENDRPNFVIPMAFSRDWIKLLKSVSRSCCSWNSIAGSWNNEASSGDKFGLVGAPELGPATDFSIAFSREDRSAGFSLHRRR